MSHMLVRLNQQDEPLMLNAISDTILEPEQLRMLFRHQANDQ